MSRGDLLMQIYEERDISNKLRRVFDGAMIPYSIASLFSQQDLDELTRIATSIKMMGKSDLKFVEFDKIMLRRGFRRLASGTNRITYYYMWDQSFIAKVGIDKIGMNDNISEYYVQHWLKPFCCKVFETSTNGIIAFIERVIPVRNRNEFYDIRNDVFNIIMRTISSNFVMEDIGTNFFKNWGIREGFGPVLLDYPYCYFIDHSRLRCTKRQSNGHICNGLIDYEPGFNYLHCEKCGERYTAKSLGKSVEDIVANNELERIKRRDEFMEKTFETVTIIDGKKYIKGVPVETYNMRKQEEMSKAAKKKNIESLFVRDSIKDIEYLFNYEQQLLYNFASSGCENYISFRRDYVKSHAIPVTISDKAKSFFYRNISFNKIQPDKQEFFDEVPEKETYLSEEPVKEECEENNANQNLEIEEQINSVEKPIEQLEEFIEKDEEKPMTTTVNTHEDNKEQKVSIEEKYAEYYDDEEPTVVKIPRGGKKRMREF